MDILAHYAVHVPLDADKRFVGKYLKAGLDSTEAKYAALIEGMDKSLGLFTKKLKQWDVQWPTYKKTGKVVLWPDEIGK